VSGQYIGQTIRYQSIFMKPIGLHQSANLLLFIFEYILAPQKNLKKKNEKKKIVGHQAFFA
jgi:hypothetical protein